ncbi:amidohydrolase family protein [Humibacter albus]|uniref:amidohydrolase family protein n=1 Tax=Humibacter albus TaxID=427754 RepID=UPI0003B41822|nr:amidohydrolase family protein [Humibacter albus]
MNTIIDHQAHWFPRRYLDRLIGRTELPRVTHDSQGGYVLEVDAGVTQPKMAELSAGIDEHLEAASAAGVDKLVIGPATLGEVLHLPAGESADLLDLLHVEYAAAQQAAPDRIAALAALPIQDPALALQVLDRAVVELGLKGVSLLTVNEGRPLVTDALMEVYARIAELGVPLFLHPGLRSTTRGSAASLRAELGIGWMHQTASAALELVDGGVLDELPQLVVVHPHLGGVLPYVAGRVSYFPTTAQHPLEHYLRTRFFTDTAAFTPGALKLALETYGEEHVLFASDHPFSSQTEMRQYVERNTDARTATSIYTNRVPGLD